MFPASPLDSAAARPAFLRNYLSYLCAQNRAFFDSPYVWQFDPSDLPLEPRRGFPEAKRTFLEIGFGHGEVLEQLVQRRPETSFVGIERRPVRIRKTLKRLHRIGAANCLLIRANLELLEGPIFAPESFDEILINHPDPWPKRRHERHRFFQRDIMPWLTDLLAAGGTIEVASDQREYFFHILRLFEESQHLRSIVALPGYTREPLEGRIMSRFEKRVRAAGNPVWILRFQKS
jgi:tRNA (guanine-N7-)-methyltransferase